MVARRLCVEISGVKLAFEKLEFEWVCGDLNKLKELDRMGVEVKKCKMDRKYELWIEYYLEFLLRSSDYETFREVMLSRGWFRKDYKYYKLWWKWVNWWFGLHGDLCGLVRKDKFGGKWWKEERKKGMTEQKMIQTEIKMKIWRKGNRKEVAA